MGPNLPNIRLATSAERRDRLFEQQLVILDSSLGFIDDAGRWSEWFANNRVGEL
jgi:hypothetical protein